MRNVLADDVELYVDHRTGFDGMEVRVIEGVRDDADLEGIACGTAYGEAYAVDRHAAFVHGKVSVPNHFLCALVLEGVLVAALLVLHGDAGGCLIHMSLNNVSVQAAVHQHGTFHVHLVAHLEQAEVAAFQRLTHGCDGVGRDPPTPFRGRKTHDSEANAIVSNALVDAQLLYKWAGQGQVDVVLLVFYGNNACHTFYDTGKHEGIYYLTIYY